MEIIGYLFIAIPYLFAAALGLAFPVIALGIYNHLLAGLAVIGATWIFDCLSLGQPLLQIGLTIFTPDIPMAMIACVALLRWLANDNALRPHPAWVVLLLVFWTGLLIGLGKNGSAAGVQARGDFYALAAASYAMSFKVSRAQIEIAFKTFTLMALVLLAICLYRWAVYYLPIRSLLPPGGTYNIDGAIRVVYSNNALGIAQVLVLGLFFGSGVGGLRVARVLSPLLLGAVLLLQHRSVWLASLSGVLLSLMLSRAQRAPAWQQIILVVCVVGVTAAPLAMNEGVSSQIQSSAGKAVAGEGTVSARFSNWRSTLDVWAGDGALSIAIGRVRGSSSLRYIKDSQGNSRAIEFNAHNHYVNTLSAFGVIGFSAYLWILVYVIRGLRMNARLGGDDSPVSGALLVLMGTQLVYFISYGVDFLQYTILGLSAAWVAAHSTRSTEIPKRRPRMIFSHVRR